MQLDILSDLDKTIYAELGANEHGVFVNREIVINAQIKSNNFARVMLATDGKYWHIGIDVMLPAQGTGYWPSTHDKWRSREQAYRRGKRLLLARLARVLRQKYDGHGDKKAARQLINKLNGITSDRIKY